MDLQLCQQQLGKAYAQYPQLQSNISQLTQKAWGVSKKDCFSFFDNSVTVLNDYLSSLALSGSPSVGDTHLSTPSISTAETSELSHNFAIGLDHVGSFLRGGMWFVIWIIVLFAFWKLIKYLLVFIYDVINTHRLQYLKISLPRGDSKLDREQEKEIAKDMKEKIGRMSQVYRSFYHLGDLSFNEKILGFLFYKPKFVLLLHYESGNLEFFIGTYPEYRKVVEGALSAQYPEVSLEIVAKPNFYSKRHFDILPLEPERDPIYPIRIFKQLEDDPLNNLVDSMAKIPDNDTFNILMSCKPVDSWFNKKATKRAEGLYRNDKTYVAPRSLFLKILSFPIDVFKFITGNYGGDKASKESQYQSGGKDFVRMLKSQEDSINVMGEEAVSQAFLSSLMFISSSDDPIRAEQNVLNAFAACSIYRDEYNNEFVKDNFKSDIAGSFFKPLWKLASYFCLPSFFFKSNIFTANALASLFHLPDGVYNRSPIISRMDYKILPPPDELPIMSDFNGYIMSGVVAEDYKGGKLDTILHDDYVGHWAVDKKDVPETVLEPIEKFRIKDLDGKEIVEKNGRKYVESVRYKTVYGYKLFREGVFVGVNVYRNTFSPVYMKRDDRTRHHYIIGKSGTGKSVYIANLARQDVWNGDGVCVIDPHGDLVEEMLEYIPKERAKDIIYFDAGDEDRPMGLNLYEINSIDQADRTVNDATEMFIKMFGPEIFGPRIQEYFKFGSLTILEDFDDRPTLLDVPRLYTDDAYREYKRKKVQNPVVKNFWDKTFEAMGDREKQEIIPYFTSKFVSFNTNRLIRNIIGQTKSAFDFEDVMNNEKILLINLSKGKIGELNAQLLGMVIVSKIYNGAMARARLDKKDRKDFYLYVDEFQNFITDTFADILSEARKYRLSLIMAHQYIAQLDSNSGNNIGEGKSKVKDAVFGNVGSMQSFKVGAQDGEFLEKEYAPVLSTQDIVGISNYKAYMKLNINNTTSRVFSMTSVYSSDYRSKKIAAILKEYSAKKYGRKREFVDAEISARLGMGVDETSLESGDTSSSETKAEGLVQVHQTSDSSSPSLNAHEASGAATPEQSSSGAVSSTDL